MGTRGSPGAKILVGLRLLRRAGSVGPRDVSLTPRRHPMPRLTARTMSRPCRHPQAQLPSAYAVRRHADDRQRHRVQPVIVVSDHHPKLPLYPSRPDQPTIPSINEQLMVAETVTYDDVIQSSAQFHDNADAGLLPFPSRRNMNLLPFYIARQSEAHELSSRIRTSAV